MLSITGCTKTFKKKKALDSFTVQIGKGVYGLLGPNGAGKTTLMRCICGLYRVDSGSIERTAHSAVGYLPQKFGMFRELTVYEMMEYFATLKDIDKKNQTQQIERCVEEVNLSDRMYDRIATLSGGMVRRLGIAQALLGDPEFILFDEPTAGLDPEERMRFKNILAHIKGNNTIIISTHIVSDVEAVCGNILIMDSGRLVASGSGAQIAGLAEQKVYLVPAREEPSLCGNFYIKDRTEENGKAFLHVLSAQEQNGTVLPPTVEDGFLCALKKI